MNSCDEVDVASVTEVAVSRVGIMITPNQPKYRRLLVDVMNDANLSQGESERSERSQIEDVTNYCSNVAQGFKEMGGMLR